jgi:hypothetical protein
MAEEQLTITERLKVLRMERPRYRQADKAQKGRILDSLERLTGLDRKTIIRRLHGPCTRRSRSRQRKATYGPEVDDALRVIYRAYDGACAERLTPHLADYAAKLAAHGHLHLTPQLSAQLAQISVSRRPKVAVRRHLQRFPQDAPRPRRPPPGPRNPLRAAVPAERIACFESEPGHLEADLVHHCGGSTAGDYLHTLHLVDVASGWSEIAAVLGRSYLIMADGFSRCQMRLPFAVREIHPDNGSEFFNAHLLRFFGERFRGARLSRSRPWQKNDNRFVEQRNGALIRRWLGDDRLDSVIQAHALQEVCDRIWIYHNLFQPVMRVVSKVVDPLTGRLRRAWDDARTPLERVVASGCLDEPTRCRLSALYDRTDPWLLREQIEEAVAALFRLPGAKPGRTEDVRQTLAYPLTLPLRKEEAIALGDVIK